MRCQCNIWQNSQHFIDRNWEPLKLKLTPQRQQFKLIKTNLKASNCMLIYIYISVFFLQPSARGLPARGKTWNWNSKTKSFQIPYGHPQAPDQDLLERVSTPSELFLMNCWDVMLEFLHRASLSFSKKKSDAVRWHITAQLFFCAELHAAIWPFPRPDQWLEILMTLMTMLWYSTPLSSFAVSC